MEVLMVGHNTLRAVSLCGIVLFMVVVAWAQQPQQISKYDKQRALEMLEVISNDVKKHYYDPAFHGLDWEAKVKETKEKIDKAPSLNMAMSNIAAVLDSLNDSHTFFLPPQHAYHVDYGYHYQMIGDRCFITRVRPKSDADRKGVKPGDEIISLNGYGPTRDNLWKMQYVFSVLRPQPSMRLGLQDPAGAQ